MADTQDYSDLLPRLISAEVILAHPDPTTLVGADLDALKSVLRGEFRPDFPVDRKRALEVLARSEASPETAALLGGVLSEPDAPVELRMIAAQLLRRMPPEAAEPPLIAALKTDDARLRRAVLGSLAQVGGEAAQKALAAMPETPELASARLLIVLRGGAHDGGLSEVLGIGSVRITADPLPDDDARRILDVFGGRAGGVPLTPEGAVGFTCQAARHAVLLAREADFSRAGIVAAVLRDGDEPGDLSLRYLVVIAAAKDGVEIALVTPSGRADYAGHGRKTSAGLTFRLRDTGAASIPLSVEAKVASGTIRLTLDLPEFRGRAARPTRSPTPILTPNRARAR